MIGRVRLAAVVLEVAGAVLEVTGVVVVAVLEVVTDVVDVVAVLLLQPATARIIANMEATMNIKDLLFISFSSLFLFYIFITTLRTKPSKRFSPFAMAF